MSTAYIKSLDGIRAIAIILVMTFHFGLTHFGWFGVQLFFVLSGFLISGILWKQKFNNTSVGGKFKKFWVRRSLRIFPLYFGYLFFLGVSYIIFHFPSYYNTYILNLVTYTFNFTRTFPEWKPSPLFTHLWSLSVEEQFYLFFPVIVFLFKPRIIKAFMIFVILFSPVSRYILGVHYQNIGLQPSIEADAVYWNTLSHLDAFFMGGIIPIFSLQQRVKEKIGLFIVILATTIVAGIINYIYSSSGNNFFTDFGYNHGQVHNFEHVWHYSLLNIFFASFILVMIDSKKNIYVNFVRRFLEREWLVRIGRVSYGMYIFHWAIFYYFYEKVVHFHNYLFQGLSFIPYLILVFIFSEISFRLYELKFIRLKDRYFK